METAHTSSVFIGAGVELGAIKRKDAEIKLNAEEASIQSGFFLV